jgi:hypothetical protein
LVLTEISTQLPKDILRFVRPDVDDRQFYFQIDGDIFPWHKRNNSLVTPLKHLFAEAWAKATGTWWISTEKVFLNWDSEEVEPGNRYFHRKG